MANKLAFTCGDPAGIGPEIIAAWPAAQPAAAGGVAVIGPARWLETLPGSAAKIPVGLEEFAATPGQPDGEGALVAWAALERAAQGCKAGEFSGVVTGPVSKERLAKIGYGFSRQTRDLVERHMPRRPHQATRHVPLHPVAPLLRPHLLHPTLPAGRTP